jgi:hypothetical protein
MMIPPLPRTPAHQTTSSHWTRQAGPLPIYLERTDPGPEEETALP